MHNIQNICERLGKTMKHISAEIWSQNLTAQSGSVVAGGVEYWAGGHGKECDGEDKWHKV